MLELKRCKNALFGRHPCHDGADYSELKGAFIDVAKARLAQLRLAPHLSL
ncbi:hypothetical protein PRN20_12630 [Devosia sp. ZB163]|nr:hypothetical protein [Devosia sp. ZB163]MDC9824582.1 hypothetical protein [Devosia sp. ZB163]